ncbi:hypothetical protein Q4E93_13250 [Flavitalea sp. BT771]|uniref:hypothetical protein n=1 Tax=Flavitalea sp. BT771 TaxID=3063329 RepID=UPI0026E290A6|nr:hypothetical protein [Flavitalea sp. BT771]MDO6431565.1 hypothetical protein [Flavitalea sp. BT771]MDV6220473.1 hypothetical protein [Flavitalea sp. BT771]
MKRVLWVLLCMGLGFVGNAQTFAEWFKQNSTRRKYYGKQIAALQMYIGQVEKGYQLVESGLGTIRDIKSGEYNMHNAFYTALGEINPSIRNLAEVIEIAALQVAIVERFTGVLARYGEDSHGHSDQVAYLSEVYTSVLNAGLADVNALLDILTVNKLQLSDDQRAGRIRNLDTAMRDRYAFTMVFTDQADLLARERQAERANLGVVKGLYGIP